MGQVEIVRSDEEQRRGDAAAELFREIVRRARYGLEP